MKEQIVRGVAGFGLLAVAVWALIKDDYAVAMVCAALSVIPLRGCPSCWLKDTCDIAGKKSAPAPNDRPDEPQQG